jgi:hypothetical protein
MYPGPGGDGLNKKAGLGKRSEYIREWSGYLNAEKEEEGIHHGP